MLLSTCHVRWILLLPQVPGYSALPVDISRGMQVLWLDITCLIDHLMHSSTVAASLTALRELHLEMVGYLDRPEVTDAGGCLHLSCWSCIPM